MLRNVEELNGFAVSSTTVGAGDGEIGAVKDVYFDDQPWAIRYMVVETGGWLSGRKVLISPIAVHSVAWGDKVLHVNLSQQQVQDSPGIDTDKPVSRQTEIDSHNCYGQSADTHLRSSREVIGYEVMATDGSIGSVENFVFDDKSWAIRHMVVDTRKWLPGKHVLLSPEWIERVSWSEHEVFMKVTRKAIQASPEYDPSRPLSVDA